MDWLTIVVIFTFSACLSPGPNNLMLFLSGMNFGIKRSLPHYFGICLAYPLKILLVGVGITKLTLWLPSLGAFIHIAAIGFLIWYVIQVLHVAHTPQPVAEHPMTYHEAEIFQWLNVKGWAVAISANTLVPLADEMSPFYYCVLLALIFTLISLPVYFVILWLGAVMRHQAPVNAAKQLINQLASLLLLGSALMLLVEEAQTFL